MHCSNTFNNVSNESIIEESIKYIRRTREALKHLW